MISRSRPLVLASALALTAGACLESGGDETSPFGTQTAATHASSLDMRRFSVVIGENDSDEAPTRGRTLNRAVHTSASVVAVGESSTIVARKDVEVDGPTNYDHNWVEIGDHDDVPDESWKEVAVTDDGERA
ncbi:MAG: hypothetical protein ABEL76_12830 [Bradymonadaceae bacterium]